MKYFLLFLFSLLLLQGYSQRQTLFMSPLSVTLNDTTIGSTVMKRKLALTSETYTSSSIILSWSEQWYARNTNNSFGALISEKEQTLVADNSYFVDINTYKRLCDVEQEYINQTDTSGQSHSVLNPLLVGKQYCPAFDYYRYIAATQPIIMDELITLLLKLQY